MEAVHQEAVHQAVRRLPRMCRRRHLRQKQQRLRKPPRKVQRRRRRPPRRAPWKQRKQKKWVRASQTNPQRLLRARKIRMRNRAREPAGRAAAAPESLPPAIPQRLLKQRNLTLVPAPVLTAQVRAREARATALVRPSQTRTRAALVCKARPGIEVKEQSQKDGLRHYFNAWGHPFILPSNIARNMQSLI